MLAELGAGTGKHHSGLPAIEYFREVEAVSGGMGGYAFHPSVCHYICVDPTTQGVSVTLPAKSDVLSGFELVQPADFLYHVSNIMSEPILQVTDLVRYFGAVKAVDGISFELQAGQSVGLIGANGAGKTTTMRLLTTLDLPDSGEIFFAGTDAMAYPEKVRARIGWMPDSFDPLPHTTVHEYVDFFARAYGLTGRKRVEEVARVLTFCGIEALRDRYINKLSKGQTQRLSLARTLIGNPDFLVMDEPAAGLDPQARIEFKQLVRELQKQGKTLLISSHILSELAEMCDSMIFMDKGHIIRRGSQEELAEQVEKGCCYSIRPAKESTPLLAWLAENPGWEGACVLENGCVQAVCKADGEEAQALALRALCAENLVTEVARYRRNLEETFVNILQERK